MKSRKKNLRGRKFAEGYNPYKIFWIFLMGGFFGAVIEIIFCKITTGEWISRSSLLYGQFSIVWGLGIVAFTVTFHRLQNKRDLYIFIIGTLLGGIYEYICSLVIEMVLGVRFWDYSAHHFNLNGRINLLYCFFWGIIALLWVKDTYPKLSNLIERIPVTIGKTLTWIILFVLTIDVLISSAALLRMSKREDGYLAESKLEYFLDEHYQTDYLSKRYKNMLFHLE